MNMDDDDVSIPTEDEKQDEKEEPKRKKRFFTNLFLGGIVSFVSIRTLEQN